MKPKQQRKALGNYGVACFDSPLASVEGYMLNINTNTNTNTNNAYNKLRRLRAQLRAKNETISGFELAGTLNKYSKRGQDYIDGLREMIGYKKLQFIDNSYLADNRLIHLTGGE
jgi:Bax protein